MKIFSDKIPEIGLNSMEFLWTILLLWTQRGGLNDEVAHL
jgi:hypothetical protein